VEFITACAMAARRNNNKDDEHLKSVKALVKAHTRRFLGGGATQYAENFLENFAEFLTQQMFRDPLGFLEFELDALTGKNTVVEQFPYCDYERH